MPLPAVPIIKKFFTNKIESSRSSWYDYLIRIARIFLQFDGKLYDRDALLDTFAKMSNRDANADRDASNFRDEFGAYGTYLGIYHLEQRDGEWIIVVSDASKRFLCSDSPNASAFCRAQLALFQYPNGAGAVLASSKTITVQANSKNDTMRELANGIHLNPFRLICEIVVSQVELRHVQVNNVTIPFHTLFCMVNDERINTEYNHDLATVDAVYTEYSRPIEELTMNMDGLTNFKRNFHILERTNLFIRDSQFGLMVSQVNPDIAYGCIKTIAEIRQHYSAFDEQSGNPDDDAVKDILCLPSWGQYYDAATLSEETLQALGAIVDLPPLSADMEDDVIQESISERDRVANGENVLLYGVPGAGKSWTIQHEYCSDESLIERLVFHPDYTYADFVGQILPTSIDGSVKYVFTPGPFTRILKRAYEDPSHAYYLIIEEINRGNAPAIFGDIFQLLDRTEEEREDIGPAGCSEYGITNGDVAEKVYGNATRLVRIPSNMSILATMNTADQNVFTLDTAFQRRWHMRMVENSFANHRYADTMILDTPVTWRRFCTAINQEILTKSASITSAEDKRLGAYFVSESVLIFDHAENDETRSESERLAARKHNRLFAEKVIKYLWDDAFKYYRGDIFDLSGSNSLERVIGQFMDKTGVERLSVFKEEIRNLLLSTDE